VLVIVTAAVMMALTVASSAAATPGDLDPAYGTGGKTTVSFAADDLAFASALQSDGSLITVGSTSGAGGHDMAVSRTGGGYTLRVVIAGASQPGQYDINSADQQTFLSVSGHGTFRFTVFAAPGLEGHLDGIWQIHPGNDRRRASVPPGRSAAAHSSSSMPGLARSTSSHLRRAE
jgi:hypothetical protein